VNWLKFAFEIRLGCLSLLKFKLTRLNTVALLARSRLHRLMVFSSAEIKFSWSVDIERECKLDSRPLLKLYKSFGTGSGSPLEWDLGTIKPRPRL
jgi:hypothetical protein